MSQKRTAKNRKRQERKRQRRQLTSVPGPDPADGPDDQDLMVELDAALRHPHPLGLVSFVGTMLSLTDPRRRGPFRRDDEDDVLDLEVLLESFLTIDIRQTTAALHVIAALVENDLTAVRIRRELAQRRHPMPGWLTRLADVEVYRTVELTDVLGDGDDVILGIRFAGGAEATVLVYIDHNLGGVVKDGFVVEEPIETVLTTVRDHGAADQGATVRDLHPADARTRIAEGIEHGAITYPPLESDTWPACRPVVEWLLRRLPPGGQGYQRPDWDDAAKKQLQDAFFASPYGVGLDDPDRRGLLETLLWFGTDYGPGDPLRWSPVNVEMLLADWLPRKVVADAAYLSKAPELLRAFIRYCHDRRGVRESLTTETLAGVDRWEPEYQRLIRSSRPQGALALAAAMQAAAQDDVWYDDPSFEEIMLESLERKVGDRDTLMDLGISPLPDEEFEWAGVPDDIRPRVGEVLDLCDACCSDLFDVEHRTACRRFLRRVAVGDPDIFRRAGKATTAAAAVCWVIGKANDAFTPWGLTVQEMMGFFGLKGGAQRAGTFLRAAGVDDRQYGGMKLGTPDLLVAAVRSEIVEYRDRYLASTEG